MSTRQIPVDITYYNLLGVPLEFTDIELKKAYRRKAIEHHPDKNLQDPESAALQFQELSRAYQVLSDPNLRAIYDAGGLNGEKNSDAFEAPHSLFARVFGGESFQVWIGELSYVADLIRRMELLRSRNDNRGTPHTNSTSTPRSPYLITAQQTAPTHTPYAETHTPTASQAEHNRYNFATDAQVDADRRAKRQYEDELEAFRRQREAKFHARITSVAQAIAKRVENILSLPPDSHRDSIRHERELLKLESFGVLLLHEIGSTLMMHAAACLNPGTWQVFGLLGTIKDKTEEFRDSYRTMRKALEVEKQRVIMREEHEKLAKGEEEAAGDFKGSDPRKEERERIEMGLILDTCWHATKKEVHDVLRAVCKLLLQNPKEDPKVRIRRAEVLQLVGAVFKQAKLDPQDHGADLMFETLVTEAAVKTKRTAEDRKKAARSV